MISSRAIIGRWLAICGDTVVDSRCGSNSKSNLRNGLAKENIALLYALSVSLAWRLVERTPGLSEVSSGELNRDNPAGRHLALPLCRPCRLYPPLPQYL